MHVEQGHHKQRNICRGKLIGGNDVGYAGCQVAMTQGDPLGAAGGAAGVQKERDVRGAGGVGEGGGGGDGGGGAAMGTPGGEVDVKETCLWVVWWWWCFGLF